MIRPIASQECKRIEDEWFLKRYLEEPVQEEKQASHKRKISSETSYSQLSEFNQQSMVSTQMQINFKDLFQITAPQPAHNQPDQTEVGENNFDSIYDLKRGSECAIFLNMSTVLRIEKRKDSKKQAVLSIDNEVLTVNNLIGRYNPWTYRPQSFGQNQEF